MTGDDSLILVQTGWPLEDSSHSQPLSSRFFQPRSRSGSSPPAKIKPGEDKKKAVVANDRSRSPECSPKDRFKGAKQLFMSLERKKDKERKASASPKRNESSPQRNAQKFEKMLKKELSEIDARKVPEARHSMALEERQIEGQARWSRYEQEQQKPITETAESSRWPKSDRDTGYVSRYSRDKSRSRDFDDSPPSGRPNMFVKSGKKTSPDSKLQSKRLSRFLSRETLESDGYDHIEEFEEVEKQRTKVKRQPSRTSLKLDYRRNNSRDSGRGEDDCPPEPPPGPRRGFLRREMTELDMKGYMQSKGQPEGFSKKYNSRPQPLWAPPGPRERAMSPGRNRFAGEERYPTTKVLAPEFKKETKGGMRGPSVPPDNRYPSLDLRNEKRKSLYEGAGEVMRRHHPEPNTDYRRRSYHELSDIDKLEHSHRNFQHSGRKVAAEPIGLPSRTARMAEQPARGYKHLPDHQRFPGLDRDTARPSPLTQGPFKTSLYHPNTNRGPRSFDHPSTRPAMFRHSYAEPSPPIPGYTRLSPTPHGHGRFGLASLKPY